MTFSGHAAFFKHFQAKWKPVCRPEMRQIKKIERFHHST